MSTRTVCRSTEFGNLLGVIIWMTTRDSEVRILKILQAFLGGRGNCDLIYLESHELAEMCMWKCHHLCYCAEAECCALTILAG